MGAEPVTDITDHYLECGITSAGDTCLWAGVATITWVGRSGTWRCPACGCEHEEGDQ